MLEPIITKTLSGYDLNFNGDKVLAKVRRVRLHTDGKITGDISLLLGKNKLQEPTFNFNFSSDVTRKRLIASLNEKYPDWTWLNLIDEICRQVQKLSTHGEEGVIIKPTTSDIKHPGYYIEPVIMRGVPNVIYGDKESHKTTLGLTMLGLVAVGVDDSETGLSATVSAKVAILDWENNRELTIYTLSRLVNGMTVPYFEPPYLRCTLPLADDIERIGNFLNENQADLVLLDSLGQAAGSEKFDSSGKGSALRFFEALRMFNLTSLIIAQNAKDDTGKKSIYGSTYFTYYARNIFRTQTAKDHINKDEKSVALIHEASNYSGKYEPMGFHLTYTNDSISIKHETVKLSEMFERANQTKTLLDFLKAGAKSVSAIAFEIDANDNRTRSLLSKLKSRGLVVNLGSGMWGLVQQES